MEAFKVPDGVQRRISPCPITGCWWWTGAVDSEGYGHLYWEGKTRRAHRVVLALHGRPVPDGMTTDHLCRNRGCVNPAHLEVVTNRENVLRGVGHTAQNAQKTHCVHGHSDWYTIPNGPRKGKRKCRPCALDSYNRWYQKHRSLAARSAR